MSRMLRKDEGQPLRAAMQTAGLSGPGLSTATKQLDSRGVGISPATVGFLATTGKTARSRCRRRTADLIAEALGVPVEQLFTPSVSTDTVERSSPHGDAVPR